MQNEFADDSRCGSKPPTALHAVTGRFAPRSRHPKTALHQRHQGARGANVPRAHANSGIQASVVAFSLFGSRSPAAAAVWSRA
jgi:hypothetical protein